MIPDPKIVGLYVTVLGDQHGLSPTDSPAPQAASDPSGESPASQRKRAILAAKACVYGQQQSPACRLAYRGVDCCARVARRQCQPPRQIRIEFRQGYGGVILPIHTDIAAGIHRDEHGTLE